jgi:hypothetical protein
MLSFLTPYLISILIIINNLKFIIINILHFLFIIMLSYFLGYRLIITFITIIIYLQAGAERIVWMINM